MTQSMRSWPTSSLLHASHMPYLYFLRCEKMDPCNVVSNLWTGHSRGYLVWAHIYQDCSAYTQGFHLRRSLSSPATSLLLLIVTPDFPLHNVLHFVCKKYHLTFTAADACKSKADKFLFMRKVTCLAHPAACLEQSRSIASSPGHSHVFTGSHGEISGEGLGSKLCHRPEMVDSVNTNLSWTENGGRTRFVLTESTISGPWCSFDPRPSPDFSLRLRDKIWVGPGDEASRTKW